MSAARFSAQLRDLEPELRALLLPDVGGSPPPTKLRVRRIRGSAHHVAVVETLHGARSLVVKGALRSKSWQSLDTERRLLTEVAPALAAASLHARCPTLLVAYPEHRLFVTERFVGPALDALLFGWRSRATGERIAEYLRWSGEWLARFHALTRANRDGSPLAGVIGALAAPAARAVLASVVGKPAAAELLDLGGRFAAHHRRHREPSCLVHADFTPRHVIAGAAGICVIDLASSRPGFPHEDLAHFVAFADLRPPWRRQLADRRLPFPLQESEFLRGYESVTPPSGPVHDVLLHTAILLRLVRAVRSGSARSPRRSVRARLAAVTVRLRLRRRTAETLRVLRSGPHRVTASITGEGSAAQG